MAPLYGLVEKAADIIQMDNAPTPVENGSSGSPNNSPSDNNASKNNAARTSTGFELLWTLGLFAFTLSVFI